MSKCQFIPGLDYQYCTHCRVWMPTDYRINVLVKEKEAAEQKLLDWKSQRIAAAKYSNKKVDNSKPPKSLTENIKKAIATLNAARAIYDDHTKYAKDAPPRPPIKVKPEPPIILSGYSFESDDDLSLGM